MWSGGWAVGRLILPPRSYDYYPRGRVTYAKLEDAIALLDRCLLKKSHMPNPSSSTLHPYQAVEIVTDEHYTMGSVTVRMCLMSSDDRFGFGRFISRKG